MSKYPAKELIIAFLNRRCEDAAVAANRLIEWEWTLAFSPRTHAASYKVFIRPKTRSKHVHPPQAKKKIVHQPERAQTGILRRIIRAGKTSSAILTRSILQTLSMSHRVKWLRTRYVRRFRNTLEEGHILKLASQGPASWINRKLSLSYLYWWSWKEAAWHQDLEETHLRPSSHTPTTFLVPSRYLPWFPKVPPNDQTPNHQLDPLRYSRPWPPTCANCLERRATQEHIAECNNLFAEDFPSIPSFVPALLSSPTWKCPQALLQIAKRIVHSSAKIDPLTTTL